jgi:hypothetical protein
MQQAARPLSAGGYGGQPSWQTAPPQQQQQQQAPPRPPPAGYGQQQQQAVEEEDFGLGADVTSYERVPAPRAAAPPPGQPAGSGAPFGAAVAPAPAPRQQWAPPGGPTAGSYKPVGPPAAHAVGPPPPAAQYGRSSEAPAAPRQQQLGEPRPLPAMQRQPTPGASPAAHCVCVVLTASPPAV